MIALPPDSLGLRRLIQGLCLAALAACAPRPDVPLGVATPPQFGDVDPINFGPGGPQSYPVHGIDLSKWNHHMEWRAARRAGVNFAYLKATEGGDRIDPAFPEYWEGARKAGVARGAYHFYYFCTDAETQARWFISNVPREPGTLPPVLDLEWNPFSPTCTYRPPAETVRAEVRRWLAIVEAHYGQRPIIYTTPDFYDRNDIGSLGEETWLRSTAEPVGVQYPGAPWRFWQYSSTGRVPGIDGDVDLNVFRGSRADWDAWLSRRLR